MQNFNSNTLRLCMLSCYPKLSMSLKTKLQTTHSSCVRYCLGLKDRSHIGNNKLEKINWLPVSDRIGQCLVVTASNYKTLFSPIYMGDSIVLPFYRKEIARKLISYLESKIWSDLNQHIKASASANSFKHPLKKRIFKS